MVRSSAATTSPAPSRCPALLPPTSLDDAAREAAALGDNAGAASFLLRAAELTPDPPGEGAARREAEAASALAKAGDTDEAARLAGELVGRLPPGPARAQARLTCAVCTAGSSLSIRGFVDEIELALADAKADDALCATLHLAIADAFTIMFTLEEAGAHVQAALALAERAGAEQLVVAALAEAGFEDSMLGRGVSEHALAAYERWDGVLVSPNVYSPRMVLGCAHLHVAEFDEAARLFAEENEAADDKGWNRSRRPRASTSPRRSCVSGSGPPTPWRPHARLPSTPTRPPGGQINTGAAFGLALCRGGARETHAAVRERSRTRSKSTEAAGDTWYSILAPGRARICGAGPRTTRPAPSRCSSRPGRQMLRGRPR